MSVTMRDVAARAGVSPVVVSRVLHNKATSIRVSESTAERVRKAAEDLGYRCNVWARNFRAQQTMMIAMLHGGEFFQRPQFDRGSRYFASLMDGIVEGAFKHGYSVTLCPRLLSSTPEDAMSDGRFDGLVWYSVVPNEANRQMLMGCSVPLVVIHTKAEEIEYKFPTVICDNAQGVGLAVEYLTEIGHRKIAFAEEHEHSTSESISRLEGFSHHMGRLGLPIDPKNDILDFSSDDGSDINAYLAAGPRHTAIIGHSDGLASRILEFAPRHGVSVPGQLSVVGFDSTSFCNELTPTLTSISQPLFSMGERAIDLLVQVMSDRGTVSPEVVFPCGLDIRGSTSSPPCS